MATKLEEFTTLGLVVRRTDYGDWDRMVTLLTPGMGKLDAIARGVKRPKSRLAGAIEPFVVGEFVIRQTDSRRSITQCEAVNAFFPIRCDYEKLVHAAYWLKLSEWAADAPGGGLFEILVTALDHLAGESVPCALTTFAFEAHYMRAIGMAPNMGECARCGQAVCGPAGFDAERGGVLCARCSGGLPMSEGARRILLKLPRVSFAAYTRLLERSEWPEAARLMRAFVTFHVSAPVKMMPELFLPPV